MIAAFIIAASIMTVYGMAENGRASRPHLLDGAGLIDFVLGVMAKNKGYNLFAGETRISSVAGNVSAEPDVVAVSDAAIDTDRVRLTPKAGGETDSFFELEGGPELVVEIVSDASVGKDRRRLPPAYFAARVTEFWLIDARGPKLEFVIHHRGENGFVPAAVAADGGQPSTVFSCGFQLIRGRNARGRYVYDLVVVDTACDRA
jgi:hypothetical protein